MQEKSFPKQVVHNKIFVEDTDAPLPSTVKTKDMRYTDFKYLTSGGKCIIQTCKDNYLGRTVCHKSLLKKFIDQPLEQKRFLREARVTAMMQHPNTIPVYEISRDSNEHFFFTMKLVEGLSLEEILKKINQDDLETIEEFQLERLLGIFIQIGNALSYAHSHGVIHRDIKPANIVVGPFGEVWLLDWGLAKVRHENGDLSLDEPFIKTQATHESDQNYSLTGHGSIEATPLYMSPEQIKNSAKVDERTDIYNMGTLLYELLTLEKVIQTDSLSDLLHFIKNEKPILPTLRSEHRLIPKELEAICMKCLEKNPDDRYQTITDLLKAVRSFRELKYLS